MTDLPFGASECDKINCFQNRDFFRHFQAHFAFRVLWQARDRTSPKTADVSGSRRIEFELSPSQLKLATGAVSAMAYTPHGDRLACAEGRFVRLWDVNNRMLNLRSRHLSSPSELWRLVPTGQCWRRRVTTRSSGYGTYRNVIRLRPSLAIFSPSRG
jgi:hypothetical protein